MRVEVGWTLYLRVECLLHVNSDCVHRDEIGEIVIPLKGFQKLQITRLFSIPLSYHKNETIHEGGGGDTLTRGRVSPSAACKF